MTDDTLAHDLDAARAKLVTLERLQKLREHPGFAAVARLAETYVAVCAKCAAESAAAGDAAAALRHTEHGAAQALLLELLGGPRV